jgi:hypothetical protein
MTLDEFIKSFRSQAAAVRGRCFYCGITTQRAGAKPTHAIFQTRDHVIPESIPDWTQFVESRVVVCCRKCNSVKEDLTLQEFKVRTGLETFFSELFLGIRIEDLTDIETVTSHILNNRTRCVDSRPNRRFRITLQPSEPASPASASNG